MEFQGSRPLPKLGGPSSSLAAGVGQSLTPLYGKACPHLVFRGMAQMEFQGTYCFGTGDMYCGYLDVTGKPSGRGILYYVHSGECDVGYFQPSLEMKGEGVRYTAARDAAFRTE